MAKGEKIMEDVYVDIREENESIRNLFNDKDFVSVDTLLDTIDDLLYQLNELKEEPEEDIDVWNKYDIQYKQLKEM